MVEPVAVAGNDRAMSLSGVKSPRSQTSRGRLTMSFPPSCDRRRNYFTVMMKAFALSTALLHIGLPAHGIAKGAREAGEVCFAR